jgi:hypothetical protein
MLLLSALLLTAQPAEKRSTRSDDLPPAFQSLLPDLNSTLRDVEASTAARLREGEYDHLIFYILQSTRFTKELRIEPALSARDFLDRQRLPADVRRRILDFIKTPLIVDERLSDLRARLKPTVESLSTEYSRTIRLLYEKEFRALQTQVAGLYQIGGHSTDTQVEANYAVWKALAVLKAMHPDQTMESALVIGPGLDFAPRRDSLADLPLQSYQPYALTDALIGLKLAPSQGLLVRCADINPRVVAFVNEFAVRKQPVLILSPSRSDEEYLRYFAGLGAAIGSRREDTIEVRREVAQAVTATRLNILTERLTGVQFNLVVTTNVLTYFNSKELALALTNIAGMMKTGGYFIHNDPRLEIDGYAGSLGLKPVADGTVSIARGNNEPQLDRFAIYVKQN